MKSKNKEESQLNVTIPMSLKKKLKNMANDKNTTLTELVSSALSEFADRAKLPEDTSTSTST